MFILVVAWQLFIVVTPLSVVRASNHNTISSSLGNSAVTHFFGASLLPGTWYFVINECRVPLSVTFQLSKWILLLFRSYNRLQFIRLFRHASPSSSFRCSRKRPFLLSLACASGRLSFAVGEHYYCVYFLSAISFYVRTYADASFHISIQARSTNTRFTYVQSSTLLHLQYNCFRHVWRGKNLSRDDSLMSWFPVHLSLCPSCCTFFCSRPGRTIHQPLL